MKEVTVELNGRPANLQTMDAVIEKWLLKNPDRRATDVSFRRVDPKLPGEKSRIVVVIKHVDR